MRKCKKCGFENRSDAKFCGECGAKIESENMSDLIPHSESDMKPKEVASKPGYVKAKLITIAIFCLKSKIFLAMLATFVIVLVVFFGISNADKSQPYLVVNDDVNGRAYAYDLDSGDIAVELGSTVRQIVYADANSLKQLYITDNALILYDFAHKTPTAETIATVETNGCFGRVAISDDGKRIMYWYDGTIYLVENGNKKPIASQLCDVYWYNSSVTDAAWLASDGSTCFSTNKGENTGSLPDSPEEQHPGGMEFVVKYSEHEILYVTESGCENGILLSIYSYSIDTQKSILIQQVARPDSSKSSVISSMQAVNDCSTCCGNYDAEFYQNSNGGVDIVLDNGFEFRDVYSFDAVDDRRILFLCDYSNELIWFDGKESRSYIVGKENYSLIAGLYTNKGNDYAVLNQTLSEQNGSHRAVLINLKTGEETVIGDSVPYRLRTRDLQSWVFGHFWYLEFITYTD
ncbi:MAG: zinc ribbon domain-containing protein [Oscillospiraceae bacterium]